jgi:hypothetical protein
MHASVRAYIDMSDSQRIFCLKFFLPKPLAYALSMDFLAGIIEPKSLRKLVGIRRFLCSTPLGLFR